MNILGWLRPTNRNKRLLVGLLLAGLICIQCVQEPQTGKIGNGGLTTVLVADNAGPVSNAEMLAKIRDAVAKSDHVKALELCLENYRQNYGKGYSCTFVKQETIRQQLRPQQEMAVKFLDKPFSVVMTWLNKTSPTQADRVIYVDGKWNNMVLARPAGIVSWLPTQLRDPWGEDARAHSLKPITEFGVAKATQSLIDVYKLAKANGDLVAVRTGKTVQVKELGNRTCLVLIREIRQNPKADYPAKLTETYIDTEYLIPICIKGYDWSDKFSCQYYYKNINFNSNYADRDFLPQNNDMKPPK